MKNLMLALAVLAASATVSFAQGGQPITQKAKQAAEQAGCLAGYNGGLEYEVITVSSCFAGGFVTEVRILPKCNQPGCDLVRVGPLAIVTFNCDEEVANATVTCF